MGGQGRGGNILTFLVVVLVFVGFGYVVWNNARPTTPLNPIVPTVARQTTAPPSWQEVLQAGFTGDGTAVPTIAIPDRPFVAPTLALDTQAVTAPTLSTGGQPLVFAAASTVTPPPPTLLPVEGGINGGMNGGMIEGTAIAQRDVPTLAIRATSPPSLHVPISRDPMGWDHYWLARPMGADAVNFGSNYYAYGTDGPRDAPLAIHTGIDIPNPIGTVIRAAGDGVVVFATNPDDPTQITFQNSPSYGKVAVIEHDFGYRGQPVYTLYAHTEAVLVTKGDRVKTGDPIALVGNTGHSTGPHVHFEVRVFENSYGSTYNPVLWMAPYVGHGTIAGRVVGARGEFLDDVNVQLVSGGLVHQTTTSYVFKGSGSEVNPDPNWQENFVFYDVPAGRYRVETMINGVKVSEVIDVREGETTGIELKPAVSLP